MRPLKSKARISFFGVIVFLCLLPLFADAQMFSADNNFKRQRTIPRTAFYVGIEPMHFEYWGNNTVSGVSESSAGLFSFKGSIIRARLESPGVSFYAGIGGKSTGLHDNSYFDAGVRFGYGITLLQSKTVILQVPLQVHSSYNTVSNNEIIATNAPVFQQGTFEGAIGASIDIRGAPQFRIHAGVLPSYGFSFSTRERNSSGSVAEIKGQFRLYFDHLFNNIGLTTGYDYDFREFNIEGEVFDYRALSNSFLLGITF